MTKKKAKSPTAPQSATLVGRFTLKAKTAKKKVVPLAGAQHFFRKKKIHARRIVPKTPKGVARKDKSPTARLSLAPPHAMAAALGMAGAPMASSSQLLLVRNVPLGAVADNDTASNVCEPSVAANANVVLYTGNWFAAVSRDTGATFQYIDPYKAFPNPPGMVFCCDQVALYIPKIDTFVWLLQYDQDASGKNLQRLAFAKTSDVLLGNWRYYDITPADVGLPGTFLDFPDLALGTNRLYVTFNAYDGSNWAASILVRIPLNSIKSDSVTADYFQSTANFNFRVAQSCSTKAIFAAHEDTSTLRVWHWSEGAAAPTQKDVPVATWNQGGTYTSKTPDNRNWLGRADGRLTGAAKAGNEVWFSWCSNKGGANNRPQPFIQIARVDAPTRTLIQNVNIWDSKSATCYGALASNSKKEIGMSYTIGGGTRFPTHVVAMLTGTRRDIVASASTRGPTNDSWGDYLTVRRSSPNAKLFDATGYTLQPDGTGPIDATPQYVRFGRSGDA